MLCWEPLLLSQPNSHRWDPATPTCYSALALLRSGPHSAVPGFCGGDGGKGSGGRWSARHSFLKRGRASWHPRSVPIKVCVLFPQYPTLPLDWVHHRLLRQRACPSGDRQDDSTPVGRSVTVGLADRSGAQSSSWQRGRHRLGAWYPGSLQRSLLKLTWKKWV